MIRVPVTFAIKVPVTFGSKVTGTFLLYRPLEKYPAKRKLI